jgi:hypothetical protein
MEDNAFDLAIVDPPYGAGHAIGGGRPSGVNYKNGKQWNVRPTKEYFTELKRVAKNYVVISIPYVSLNIGGSIKLIPYLKPLNFLFRYSELWFVKHKFDGQHYWEMGKKNFSRRKIRSVIKSTGLKIETEFSDHLNPYHYFFVLRK